MMISKTREAATSSPAKAPRKGPPSPPKSAEKSHQPLHNFALPPLPKWGSKRTVRSDEADRDDHEFTLRSCTPFSDYRSADHGRAFRHPSTPSTSSIFPSKPPPPPPSSAADVAFTGVGKPGPADRGIEEIREKLLVHLHTAAKKMNFRVPEDGAVADADSSSAAAGGGDESSSRPWNLRKRRAACRAPDDDSGRRDFPSSSPPPPPPPPQPESSLKSSRLRSMAAERGGGEKKERRKLSLSLSKDEIEEDIFLITGSRPARRPKKRARNVQKQVDACFPGLWLSEVTPDMYKVSDFRESGKR